MLFSLIPGKLGYTKVRHCECTHAPKFTLSFHPLS
jgi:hypothetical protein